MARSPLTFTRPCRISSSTARRDPNPARARTFWSRSPSSLTLPRSRSGRELVLHGLGIGHEVAQWRQLLQRPEPKAIDELLGWSQQNGRPHAGVAADLLDQP